MRMRMLGIIVAVGLAAVPAGAAEITFGAQADAVGFDWQGISSAETPAYLVGARELYGAAYAKASGGAFVTSSSAQAQLGLSSGPQAAAGADMNVGVLRSYSKVHTNPGAASAGVIVSDTWRVSGPGTQVLVPFSIDFDFDFFNFVSPGEDVYTGEMLRFAALVRRPAGTDPDGLSPFLSTGVMVTHQIDESDVRAVVMDDTGLQEYSSSHLLPTTWSRNYLVLLPTGVDIPVEFSLSTGASSSASQTPGNGIDAFHSAYLGLALPAGYSLWSEGGYSYRGLAADEPGGDDPAPVPEPASLMLFASGLGLAARRLRKGAR